MASKKDKKEAAGKTNVCRLLDQAQIPYEFTISDDVHDEEWSAVTTAETLGVEPERIVKTLVLRGDKNRFLVACIPASFELNLKKLARVSGDKKVEMIHVRELKEITGYVRGGCSPIGMKKPFPTFFDETVLLFETIYINAGGINAMVLVSPNQLLPFLGATAADITD